MSDYELIMIVLTVIGLLIAIYRKKIAVLTDI